MIVSQARTGTPRTWPDGVRRVGPSELDELVRFIFDGERTTWIIIVSPYFNAPMVDVGRLSAYVGDRAVIAVLADNTTADLAKIRLGSLAVWGGAVRLYAPGVGHEDDWTMHPVLSGARAGRWVTLTSVLDRFLPKPVSTVTTAPQLPEPGREDGTDTEIRQLSGRVSQLVGALAERDELISALRQEVQKLTKRVKRGAAPDPGPVWADPERQLRYEVGETWLRQVSECDRDTYPLPEHWLIGPDLLDSMSVLEVVDRSAVLAAVVDVLTGRAVEIAGRQVHQAGDRNQLIRDDGAAAWRCAIKLNRPSAPRLMWWRHTDGTVEIATAAVHDNFRIR